MNYLAEFLLARFDEDERVAENWEAHGYGSRTVAWWAKLFNGVDQYPTMHAARLRAECEAKRRIVAVCMGDDPNQGELDPHFDDEYVPAMVLRALALPYADHPDYRQEWAA